MKRYLTVVVASLIGLVIGTAIYNYDQTNKKLNETQSHNQQLINELELKTGEIQKLKEENKLLLSIHSEVAKLAVAVKIVPKVYKPVYRASAEGWVAQCHAWAAQAGISLNASAIKLLERESHCSPTAWNPSGAGGIPQALPFSKTGCVLSVSGAVCQLRWMWQYVQGRYGSWEAALSHSLRYSWY